MRFLILLCLSPGPPSQEDPSRPLIEKLRSDKVEDRDDAARELAKLGRVAMPALKKALDDKDVEVARRCQEVLDSLGAGEFKKIEETLQKAKTLRIKVGAQGDAWEGAKRIVFSATILLKEGNRANCAGKIDVDGDSSEFDLHSDGRSMKGRFGPGPAVEKGKVPEPLKAQLVSAFVTYGGAHVSSVLWVRISEGSPPEQGVLELKEFHPVGFKAGHDDGKSWTLSYRLEPKEGDQTLLVKLWYDPVSCAPLKRTLTFESGGKLSGRWSEDYEEVTLNSEIPDDAFKIEIPDPAQVAKMDKARAQLAVLRVALSTYEVDNGVYPGTEQGLQALVRKPDGAKNWKGPYIDEKEVPKDPWGTPPAYRCPGVKNPTSYDLSSAGPDGKHGTGDDIRR